MPLGGKREFGTKELLKELRATKKGGLQDVSNWLNNAFAKVFGTPNAPGANQAPEGAEGEFSPTFALQSNHANAPSVSVTRPTPYELKISLNFPLSFLNEAARLNLDLTSLGIPGLGNLVDFNAASNIDIDTTMRVQLDLGFDLTNAENPRPFIYDTTNITVELQAKADRIDMKAAIGPLGVSVLNGSLTLDRDGNGN